MVVVVVVVVVVEGEGGDYIEEQHLQDRKLLKTV